MKKKNAVNRENHTPAREEPITEHVISGRGRKFGFLGQYFECNSIPAAGTEASLLSCVTRRSPPQTGAPPKFCDKVIDAWPESIARFQYFGITQGYGEFVDYLMMWKRSSGAMSLNDVAELSVYAISRLQHITTTHAHKITKPLPFAILARKGFYELIDQSEKTSISYSLGSAIAGTVANHYFPKTGLQPLVRLFHQRLIASAKYANIPLAIVSSGSRIPDYIGVSLNMRRAKFHILECKFSAAVDYKNLRSGLQQASAISSIGGNAPASRHLFISHLRSFYKNNDRVTTSVISLPRRVAKLKKSNENPALSLLNGLYMLGMSAFFLTLRRTRESKGSGYVFFAANYSNLIFCIHKDALASLEHLRERFLALTHDEQLPPLLERAGRDFFDIDQRNYERPSRSINWSAAESQWLWTRYK